ncbi:hypothetical protein F5J12DRAFT_912565 [Pisolithus orientalis]|uniref:uncharacterized protein n=1 Tax=Pisolithus orientalis TaxID=936130 RepID=UPI0022259B99|nr:uncharacterized protein F5J12DRAFT_912565 [Pisolithus orientalis]KAI6008780.1 hypothetical protein F5J12DRAFT_912565 [Pisolithus orientalis]
MHSTSQPIACQPPNPSDFHMFPEPFAVPNSAISASYFIGSPISWKPGSFGSRFYPGCSPGQLLGPLDPSDFRCDKMSSSIESDRGSILNAALGAFDREDELCKNYSCCGLQIDDLHGLVQHFEEVHVVVVDQFGQPHPRMAAQPVAHQPQPIRTQHISYFPETSTQPPAASYNQGGFDPDDMELDVDHSSSPSSGGPTPPDTPLTTPLSSHPSHSFPHLGKDGSQHMLVSAFDTTTIPTRSIHGHSIAVFPPSRNSPSNNTEPFNGYAGYSDYSSSMPGAAPLPVSDEHLPVATPSAQEPAYTRSSAPSTTQSSRDSSAPSKATSQQTSPRASITLSRPASSLLLSKPFRCPKPNCNKSYKQANGLKYHMTHGSCNFAPPKDLEQVQALLASKRSAREAAGDEDNMISEGELREVEREAERRLRPFACGIGDCQRRYKNMNGLRYHYQHSGEHGAIGLSLLASGQHECLQHAHKNSSAASSRQSTPMASGQTTPVTPSTPTYAQQYQQQMMYTSAQHQYMRAQQQAMQIQVQLAYAASADATAQI